jgi:hypothetical protein
MLAFVVVADRRKLFEPDVPARDVKKLLRGFLVGSTILMGWFVLVFVLRVID